MQSHLLFIRLPVLVPNIPVLSISKWPLKTNASALIGAVATTTAPAATAGSTEALRAGAGTKAMLRRKHRALAAGETTHVVFFDCKEKKGT